MDEIYKHDGMPWMLHVSMTMAHKHDMFLYENPTMSIEHKSERMIGVFSDRCLLALF